MTLVGEELHPTIGVVVDHEPPLGAQKLVVEMTVS
jgi:hypothetical protein